MISNRQSFRRGARQHSSSSTLRASRILATRQPQFLIRYQQLEINVNHSKQTLTPISNPQIRRNMFSQKRVRFASRLSLFSAFSLNRFRFAMVSNRTRPQFKKTDNPMKTKVMTFSNRNNNLPCGAFAALMFLLLFLVAFLPLSASAQQSPPAPGSRKVIIDQDASGPGGSDMQAILSLVQSPDTDVLGITVVTGDAWLAEEVQHTLRLMEIVGRTDIPVVPGAAFPLVNSKEYIARWETMHGKIIYQGAWNFASGHAVHGPSEIPPMPEGAPTTKPADEDAAHFLIRMVHKYPHEVTIVAAGPLTNLALAQAIDPQFASLAKELVMMGSSLNPQTDDPEFTITPRREFNLWFDPEASSRVFHSDWARVIVTTVDISIKTHMTKELIAEIAKGQYPAGIYTAKYAQPGYLWDELAAVAWLDPSVITKTHKVYMDVSTDHGASYGDTLIWVNDTRPHLGEREVEIQDDLNTEKFYRDFVELMTRATPKAHDAK